MIVPDPDADHLHWVVNENFSGPKRGKPEELAGGRAGVTLRATPTPTLEPVEREKESFRWAATAGGGGRR